MPKLSPLKNARKCMSQPIIYYFERIFRYVTPAILYIYIL